MHKVNKIHHIGIAVDDLGKAMHFWKDTLGLNLTSMEEVPSCKVSVAFLELGELSIELLSPMAGNISMEQLVRERGGGLEHLCLEVDNIDQTLEELRTNQINLRGEAPQILPGRKIAFVDPSCADGVLLEFYELT